MGPNGYKNQNKTLGLATAHWAGQASLAFKKTTPPSREEELRFINKEVVSQLKLVSKVMGLCSRRNWGFLQESTLLSFGFSLGEEEGGVVFGLKLDE